MTIREMQEKVATFNEIANVMGTEKVVLKIKVEGCDDITIAEVNDYYKAIKTINNTFIGTVAKEIVDCKEYEFDKDTVVNAIDYRNGFKFSEVVSTNLYCA